jgi:hypothetical protein
MSQLGKLPRLSKYVIDTLKTMGFRNITDRPYDFIGSVKGQHDDYGMAALLTVIPLKLQNDTFVVSLEMNGEQMVKARLVTLEDIATLVGYSGVVKEILDYVDRKENDVDKN